MLNKISKMILFYFAYLPLFIILTINNISDNRTLIVIVLFLVTSSFLLVYLLLSAIKDVTPSIEKIKIEDIKNSEYLGFIVTYVIPFLVELSGIRQIISFVILLLIIAYLYVDTSLFCINPLLKIFFRYNVYDAHLNNQRYYLLSKQSYNRIETITIHIKRLDKYILVED